MWVVEVPVARFRSAFAWRAGHDTFVLEEAAIVWTKGDDMKRRDFVATSVGGAVGLAGARIVEGAEPTPTPRSFSGALPGSQSVRSLFPRLDDEVFINAAGGTPLGGFAEEAIQRYLDVARLGRTGDRAQWWGETWDGLRARFATLIGAEEAEIGLVECTKEGEQLVLDGLSALDRGSSVVTNDLHFAGSLHNLEGQRRAGRDVRVVRSQDFAVALERIADAIDDRTALVTVSLVSNITGHIEPMAELAEVAHAHGAIVFADVIQAAGVVPINVREMGIDVAACSSYKWLYGIHGAGFLYVSRDTQGTVLGDTLFPGGSRRNYPPFVNQVDPGSGPFTYQPPSDARRYQPGHVNYLGYAAVHAGLGFVADIGVASIQEHSVRLNAYLLDRLDRNRYDVLSTHPGESPILALAAHDFEGLRERLTNSDVVVSLGGDKWNLVRISPAVYNTESDMERLAEVLHGA